MHWRMSLTPAFVPSVYGRGNGKLAMFPVARLFGKELVLLAWAIEDAEPGLAYTAIQNWRGLAPEERWWLYTMTAAQTGHHAQKNRGWRKAVRAALTENPVHGGAAAPTSAERRKEARLLARARPAPGQANLLESLPADDDKV